MLHVAFQSTVSGDPTPVAAPITFEQFARGLRRAVETEHAADLSDKESIAFAKNGMMAVIPARLSSDKMQARRDRGEKNARGSEVVEGSAVIGLDIDGCPPDKWDTAVRFLQKTGIAAVAHTSPTDGLNPAVRKGRIFVAVDREASPSEIWPLRCALAAHLGVSEWLDPQTKDPARLFFAGRLAGTPPREFVVTGATPAPASALLARYPHVVADQNADTPSKSTDTSSPVIWTAGAEHEDMMTPALVALLEGEYARGGRHKKVRALGAVLAQAGWSDAGITRVVARLPSDQTKHRIEQALDAAKLARAGERVHQLGSLRETFGHRIATHVAELAKQPEIADIEAAVAFAVEQASVANPDDWGTEVEVEDLHAELEEVPWLVEKLCIAPGPPTLIAGYGGLGKSMLAQLMVVCFATGHALLDTMPVRGGRVLHLDYEQGRRLTRTRYQRLAAELKLPPDALRGKLKIRHAPPVNLVTPGFEQALTARIAHGGYTVCLVDSLRAAAPGLDENDSRIREPLDMLWRVSEKTGCVFIVIHHARKDSKDSAGGNQNMRGNSAINDAAQTVLMLEGASHGFNVVAGKVRDGRKFEPIGIAVEDTKPEHVKFDGLALRVIDIGARAAADTEAEVTADMATVLAMVQASPGQAFLGGKAALCELAPCGKTRASRAVTMLVQRGVVYEQVAGGRKAIICSPPGATS